MLSAAKHLDRARSFGLRPQDDRRALSHVAFDRWEALAASRASLAVMFLWAVAEATVWPIIPDFLLVPLAVGAQRRFLRPLLASILGSTLGGAALYVFAHRRPSRARALLAALPFVAERHVRTAEAGIAEHGAWAFLLQPWSGVAFKVWALVAASRGVDPALAIPASVAGRALRMAISAALPGLLSARFRRTVRDHALALTALYGAAFGAVLRALMR
ncbi:MAG TPA: hypothetical protein VFC51_12120 [Chloroflexota bacterium]|nr:hypothetical protein [Chloroflexota bacterium]